MTVLETSRHQVAIAGRVADAQTGRGLGAALVKITAAPAEFTAWLNLYALQYGAAWARRIERPDQKVTAADGHFHFVDLPDGQYTLAASLPGFSSRYGTAQAQATVTHTAEAKIVMVVADLALRPTTLKGKVAGPNGATVVMAQVRVIGSGERTYTDGQGRYLLTGLEAGRRQISVSAQGFEPTTQAVMLNAAGNEQTVNFSLVPSTP